MPTLYSITPEDVTGEDKRGRRNRFVLVAIAFFLCFQKMVKQHECAVNTSCTGSNEKYKPISVASDIAALRFLAFCPFI